MSPRVIHVCMYGGLGNQLFQLGSALAASKYSKDDAIVLDFYLESGYQRKHPTLLGKIIDLNLPNIQVKSSFSFIGFTRIARLMPFHAFNRAFVSDSNVENATEKTGLYRRYYFDGYFQDYLSNEYFAQIKNQIAEIMVPSFALPRLTDDDQLLIHIRGGDFLLHPHGTVCDVVYYKSALETMLRKRKYSKTVVVTDDPNYSKTLLEALGVENVNIISGSDPFEDFMLIAESKYRILSNSTFGLWASELGNNPNDGLVICPRYFYPGSFRSFNLKNEISILEKS